MAFGLLLSSCDEAGGAEGRGWHRASFPEAPASLMFDIRVRVGRKIGGEGGETTDTQPPFKEHS